MKSLAQGGSVRIHQLNHRLNGSDIYNLLSCPGTYTVSYNRLSLYLEVQIPRLKARKED